MDNFQYLLDDNEYNIMNICKAKVFTEPILLESFGIANQR